VEKIIRAVSARKETLPGASVVGLRAEHQSLTVVPRSVKYQPLMVAYTGKVKSVGQARSGQQERCSTKIWITGEMAMLHQSTKGRIQTMMLGNQMPLWVTLQNDAAPV